MQGGGTTDAHVLRVLGPVVAGPPHAPVALGGRRQRTVLALLAARHGRTVTVDRLIDELWMDHPPGGPRKTVQTYVSSLRSALASTGIELERDGDGYRLLPGVGELDLRTFEDALSDAVAAGTNRDRLAALRMATSLWSGHPFSNVGDSRLLDAESSRLTDRFLDAEQQRLELELEVGDAATVAAAAEAVVAEHPWREAFWRILLDALPAAGRAANAAAVADRARTTLAAELGSVELPWLKQHARPANGSLPLAPWLARRVGPDFVGREHELARLNELLESRRGLAMVSIEGDAGIGKTRLAAEFAARAHASGTPVLAGRFDEHVRPPYRAVTEMLGRLADHEGEEAILRRGGPEAAEFARLSERFGPTPRPAEPDVQRYRIAVAMGNVLRSLAAERRIVVVFDDVQWAGPPTLAALTQLATELSELDAVVVLTARSAETDGPVDEFLTGLRAHDAIERVELDGLSADAVGELIGETHGRRAHAYTGGNPLFVTELARHLESGGALGATELLTDVVRQRIDRLGPTASHVLRSASVIGSPFSFAALSLFPDIDPAALATALDAAQRHGVVRQVDDGLTYEFGHALVKDALYRSIPDAQRVVRHATFASALEETSAADVRSAAEIAHHWTMAVPAGHGARAVAALRTAAASARYAVGTHEAVDLLERADDVAAACGLPARTRVELLIELAESLYEAGRTAQCTDCACEAGRLAGEHGLDDLVVAAAGSLSGGDVFSDPDRGLAAHQLISHALPLQDRGSATWALLRSKAMIGEITAGVVPDDHEVDEILETVRGGVDPVLVRQVVENVAFVAVGERHDQCVDLLSAAIEPDDLTSRNPFLYESLVRSLAEADGDRFRRTTAEYRRTTRGNEAHHLAADSAAAVIDFWDGRTRRGYRRGHAAMFGTIASRPQSAWSGMLMWAASRAFVLDRADVLTPLARDASSLFRVAMFDSALAWAEASSGDPGRIRSRVERRSEGRIRMMLVPRLGGPVHWLTVLACLADGSPASVAYARDIIELARGPAFHGMPHTPNPCMAHLSARVALAEGDVDRAVDDAEGAVDDYRSMTSHVFVPLALADLSAALLARGDTVEADAVTEEAHRLIRARRSGSASGSADAPLGRPQ